MKVRLKIDKKEQLIDFYSKVSKHSHYQVLPKSLEKILGQQAPDVKTRYEKERLDYFNNKVDFSNKKFIDVGGNTGFFSFEVLTLGAKEVIYYEGNKEHANFVELAKNVVDLNSKLIVRNQYLDFNDNTIEKADITLLLNVLHHIGDDYGNKDTSIESAKEIILNDLNLLANNTKLLIFQLGFNWKGDRNICLFEKGTKKEMIEYIKSGTKDHWEIQSIGIAEDDSGIVYKDLNDNNIKRNDSLGEFLNRPIFIMESKKYE